MASPSPVMGKTPCRNRGVLFTRVLLGRDGDRGLVLVEVGLGAAVRTAAAGWSAGSGRRSAGGPIRATATAQVLKGGILDVGSSAPASVSALTEDPPPQWKGTKTTSGRIA